MRPYGDLGELPEIEMHPKRRKIGEADVRSLPGFGFRNGNELRRTSIWGAGKTHRPRNNRVVFLPGRSLR